MQCPKAHTARRGSQYGGKGLLVPLKNLYVRTKAVQHIVQHGAVAVQHHPLRRAYRLIGAEILRTKKMYEENWSRMERLIEKWTPKASVASSKITKLKEHILLLEEEVEVILMERIRDKANAERYDRMIAKREEQIAEARKQIEELQNVSEVLRSRQAKLKRDISLIDDILQEGKMSEAHLRMLVEKILVHEEDGKLDLEIRLKAPFRDHLDIFENGAQTDCFPSADFDYDRLGAVIYGDYYAG